MHTSDESIDEALQGSFPASDSPPWTLGDAGEQPHPSASCDQLLREHRNTSRLLDLLERELRQLRSGEPDYNLMIDVLHYLGSYVDRHHHPREEAAFALAARRASRLAEAAATVEHQHSTLIGSASSLLEDVQRAQMDLPVQTARLLEEGTSYVQGLREHMRYEEAELFPEIASILTARDWEHIDTEHGPVRDPLFGPQVQARYRSLFEQLVLAAGCDCRYR